LSERRRAFRVATVGRVAWRLLEEHEEVRARLAVVARSVPDMTGSLGIEDALASDERVQVKLLERMACYLNRIDRRMEELCELQRGRGSSIPSFCDPIPLSLSAAGLSGELDIVADAGTLVELTLDLLDDSLPLIPAVGSIVRNQEQIQPPDGASRPADDQEPASANPDIASAKGAVALHFEAMTSVDRERIFRFATRIQRESLRDRKGKESQ